MSNEMQQNNAMEMHSTQDSAMAWFLGVVFLGTAACAYFIVVTVRHTPQLRIRAYCLFLRQLCICVAGFNAAGCLRHSLRALGWAVPRLTFCVIFNLQVALGRAVTITLTCIVLNVCLTYLHPLRYPQLERRLLAPIITLGWFLALLNPVLLNPELFNPALFTALAGGQSNITEKVTSCPDVLENQVMRDSRLALLVLLAVLVLGCSLLVCVSGCQDDHISEFNILVVHCLPLGLILAGLCQNMAGASAYYVVFCVPQPILPVVYGLHCHDLWEHLQRFLPRWILALLRCQCIDTVAPDILEPSIAYFGDIAAVAVVGHTTPVTGTEEEDHNI